MLIDDDIERDVLFALRHLYDPEALRQCQLVDRLGVPRDGDSAVTLRQLLRDAIRSMRPDSDVPADTRARRDYQVLYYRYVQGCSQLEVADQVGLSVRQLRREEQKAVAVLARRLGAELDIEPPVRERDGDPTTAGAAGVDSTVTNELAWLAYAEGDELCDLGQTLGAVLELTAPVTARHGARLVCSPLNATHLVAANTVAVRQTLLVLLTVAIRHAEAGCVHIELQHEDWAVATVFEVQEPAGQSQEPSQEDLEGIKIARHLLSACAGKVSLDDDSGHLRLVARFPMAEQVPILVIEDSADTVRLLERFLLGTRFRLHSVSRVKQALELAACITPRVIILDIVMPDVDGWESLSRLQQHPATQNVPVLVCTILPEQELALSLGAAGFVRKPFRRLALRQALERLAGRGEKVPR